MGLEVKQSFKEYIDDLFAERVALSAYTDEDSDNLAMLKAHAYRAQTDGWVSAHCTFTADISNIKVYVGLTADPAGAGDLIQQTDINEIGGGYIGSVCALVAKDEYFEITVSGDTPVIWWKSMGALLKPIDFN